MPPFVNVGVDLSFRLVSKQVLSALVSLTSVFGMGTGGPSPLKTPTYIWNIPNIHYSVPLVKGFLEDDYSSSRMVHLQGLEPWTP